MNNAVRRPEKRRFKRVSVNVKLFYKVQKPPELCLRLGDKEICTQTVDISQGGLGFVTACELPPATSLFINFHLIFKGVSLLTIKATGNVQHCNPLPLEFNEGPSYRIGVAFSKIDDTDRDFLGDFVKDAR